jgi:hypothetical protein
LDEGLTVVALCWRKGPLMTELFVPVLPVLTNAKRAATRLTFDVPLLNK